MQNTAFNTAELKKGFQVVALEERLEMVQMAAFGEEAAISCFLDGGDDKAAAEVTATVSE